MYGEKAVSSQEMWVHTGAVPLEGREQEDPLGKSWSRMSRPRREEGDPGRGNRPGVGDLVCIE